MKTALNRSGHLAKSIILSVSAGRLKQKGDKSEKAAKISKHLNLLWACCKINKLNKKLGKKNLMLCFAFDSSAIKGFLSTIAGHQGKSF